jgi:hypothetical protein
MNQMSFNFLPASTTTPGDDGAPSAGLPKRASPDTVVSVVSPLLASENAFIAPSWLTLADIRAKAEADMTLTVTQRRDMVSGLNRIETVFTTPLEKIEASPRRLRALFASRTAAQVGLSEKSFANIRSLTVQALSRHGQPDLPFSRRFAITPA